jgi:hypothetical protein
MIFILLILALVVRTLELNTDIMLELWQGSYQGGLKSE